MYNETQKIEYLNTIGNDGTYKSCKRLLKSVSSIENRFGHDVSEFSVEEILMILDLKSGTKYDGATQMISLLKSYTDWCIQNGRIIGENNFEKVSARDSDKRKIYRRKYLSKESEIENMLNIVFRHDAFYNDTLDIPKELMIRLCWLGMEDKEIVALKKEHIINGNLLQSPLYPKSQYVVTDKMMEMIQYCIDLKEMIYSDNSGKKNRVERLCDNDYIFRIKIGGLRGEETEDKMMNRINVVRRINEMCVRYFEETDVYKELTPGKFHESKMYIYVHDRDHGDVLELLSEYIIDEYNRKGIIKSKSNIENAIRKAYDGYCIWKSTFFN